MTTETDPLVRALDAGDALGARRALQAAAAGDDEGLEVLAERAAAGSGLALELLLEQLDERGVVVRFVRSLLLDESAVDDVSQDVLISVASSIRGFQGAAKVTTWVHRIARNRVVDHLRRQRDTTALPDEAGGPSQRMSTLIATRETVRAALADLPDLYREPVTLRDVEGLPYAEVAERLDRPVGTVKAQVARGRAMVAAALDEATS